MSRLPAAYREVLLLRYYHGYTVREIAPMLGRKPGAVQKLLTRAKAALRKILEQEDEPHGKAIVFLMTRRCRPRRRRRRSLCSRPSLPRRPANMCFRSCSLRNEEAAPQIQLERPGAPLGVMLPPSCSLRP